MILESKLWAIKWIISLFIGGLNDVTIFAGLFSSLSYFFVQNGRNLCDYQLALQRFVKKEGIDVSLFLAPPQFFLLDMKICSSILWT
jgi:hypothetical protein